MLGQAYLSATWHKKAAPANKASDLNTAVAWLFRGDMSKIPKILASRAREVRDALANNEIERVELYYIHNCYSSPNVAHEMQTVQRTCQSILHALRHPHVSVISREFGLTEIEDLYVSQDRDILVNSRLTVPGKLLGRESGDRWKSVVLSISGKLVHDLYARYGNKLFSANYRDFLGSRGNPRNINATMTNTAKNEPDNFWVYNNGITALTTRILSTGSKKTRVQGFSIINGAQTSGAIKESGPTASTNVKLLCRLVECKDAALIKKIIRFNKYTKCTSACGLSK